MNQIEENKQRATDFLKLVIKGKFEEAYTTHVDPTGKHHNVYFAKGFDVLRKAMENNHKQFPNKKFLIKNVLCDGDLVAVHSHLIMQPKEKEMVVVHLFRFKNKKIVEMWDCGQIIPTDMPNADGVF